MSTKTELEAIISELGPAEMNERIAKLSEYNAFRTVANINDLNMTPALMTKWATFAAEVAKELAPSKVIIGLGHNIGVERSYYEKAMSVARNEKWGRDQEAAKAEAAHS
jgi:hypothetical protein